MSSHEFREDWKGSSKIAKWMNKVGKAFNNLDDFLPNNRGGYTYTGSSKSTPMPKMFGYGGIVAQTKVRVLAGMVQLGERSCEVAETDVVVAGGSSSAPTWGVLRYDVNSNTGVILPATISNRPRNTLGSSPTHERAIFRAYIDKGRAVVLAPWCHEGVVDITGFAP